MIATFWFAQSCSNGHHMPAWYCNGSVVKAILTSYRTEILNPSLNPQLQVIHTIIGILFCAGDLSKLPCFTEIDWDGTLPTHMWNTRISLVYCLYIFYWNSVELKPDAAGILKMAQIMRFDISVSVWITMLWPDILWSYPSKNPKLYTPMRNSSQIKTLK